VDREDLRCLAHLAARDTTSIDITSIERGQRRVRGVPAGAKWREVLLAVLAATCNRMDEAATQRTGNAPVIESGRPKGACHGR